MNKKDIRKQLRAQLEGISFPDLISKSGALTQNFEFWIQSISHSRLKSQTLLSFYPFTHEPQIQVEPFLESVGYFRIDDWANRIMRPHFARRDLPGQWEDIEVPGSSTQRIYQPVETQPLCPIDDIGVILVPGLAFTLRGERLGRGAGFYDRFLPVAPRALRVGIAFDLQILPKLPTEAHDLPVDMILTDTQIIETNRYIAWKNHGKIERE